MIRALLFDMGGTLDGDGGHWLERFLALYRRFGVELPREILRDAFDEAERRSATDETIASANFLQMIELHVQWQFTRLGLTNAALARRLVDGFVGPVNEAVIANVDLLARLAARGFALGVVSNGCGNVDKLCDDFGYAPFLSLVVDSRRVGIFKPDPAIFQYAAEKMGHAPEVTMMIGDSFERDIVPAKKIGMQTAWLAGNATTSCSDPALVDLRLTRLPDLADALP
ncbi:MAG: HAD family hydrolase [Chthoniobacterales bacterium]